MSLPEYIRITKEYMNYQSSLAPHFMCSNNEQANNKHVHHFPIPLGRNFIQNTHIRMWQVVHCSLGNQNSKHAHCITWTTTLKRTKRKRTERMKKITQKLSLVYVRYLGRKQLFWFFKLKATYTCYTDIKLCYIKKRLIMEVLCLRTIKTFIFLSIIKLQKVAAHLVNQHILIYPDTIYSLNLSIL
ncbi:hypothetical protein ACJX0J_030064 [Zea mays]